MANHSEIHSGASLSILTDDFILRIKTRIDIGKDLLKATVTNVRELDELKNKYSKWNSYNSQYLKIAFDNKINEYKKKYDSTYGDTLGTLPSVNEKYTELIQNLRARLAMLEELYEIAEIIPNNSTPSIQSMSSPASDISKVFIVHGHDKANELMVARTLEQLGLKPIILHEQANAGKTLIEKFEHNSNVGFAIVILTGDDLGKALKESDFRNRARQNVILELGYFVGKLGREKVMPLYEEGIELPSDLSGVAYVPLDVNGSWKYKLVKELKQAGYNVDANNVN